VAIRVRFNYVYDLQSLNLQNLAVSVYTTMFNTNVSPFSPNSV